MQILYAKIRNERNGGGDRPSAVDVEVWMEAFDDNGVRVGSAKGNWLDLGTGKPFTAHERP